MVLREKTRFYARVFSLFFSLSIRPSVRLSVSFSLSVFLFPSLSVAYRETSTRESKRNFSVGEFPVVITHEIFYNWYYRAFSYCPLTV